MTLLMIAPKGLSVGIIKSQVIDKAEAISKFRRVIVAIHISQIKYFEESNSVIFFSFKNYSDLRVLLKDDIQVYCREIFSYISIYRFYHSFKYNFSTFYSFRAFAHEESYYINKSHLKRIVFYLLEFFAYISANNIGCVSFKMKEKLPKKFFFHRVITIHPCCVKDVYFKKNRHDQQKIKFVYVGGMSKWQMFDQTLYLFESISKILETEVELTIVTNEIEKAKQITDGTNLRDKQIKFVSLKQSEVLLFLKIFDFGFLIRDLNIINETASPVKFLEYISCGVIPIVSDFIGDYSALVKNEKIGLICESNQNVNLCYLNELLNDQAIYERLYEVSINYKWENLFKYNSCDPLIRM